MYLEKKYLYSRKHEGKEYKFFYIRDTSWADGQIYDYIMVAAPANSFGYPDYINLHIRNGIIGEAFTTYRYCPKWILKRIRKQMVAAKQKYCKYGL